MKRKIDTQYFYKAMLLLLTITCIACQKEKDIVNTDKKGSLFVFNITGVSTSPNNAKFASINSLIQPKSSNQKVNFKNNIDLIYDSEENDIGNRLKYQEINHNIDKKTASSSLMHDYTRYRLLLYNITKNQLEKNIESEAGKTLEIPVTEGDQYKWYAYSYNSQTSVDTFTMENTVPVVRTHKDKEFLWASSTSNITATSSTMPIGITFEHKVAEIVLELDTKDLHGKITDFEVEFHDEDYFSTGKINLLTGASSDHISYTTPILDETSFEEVPGDTTKWRIKFFTSDPVNKIENLKIKVNQLSTLHADGATRELHSKALSPKIISFNFESPQVSKSHVASVRLRYAIPKKVILHVTTDRDGDDHKMALAAQPYNRDITYLEQLDPSWTHVPANNRPPYNLIKASGNFGTTSTSIVYTGGFYHMRCKTDGEVHTFLTNPTPSKPLPDIIIISVHYQLSSDDIIELIKYLKKGGIVFMLTGKNGVSADKPTVKNFMNELFEIPETPTSGRIDIVDNYYPNGSLFEINHTRTINDKIVNGPFGNLTGKFWGVDYYDVLQLTNIPDDQIINYSNPTATNSNKAPSTNPSMFKHASYNFFWIGNAGFLSGPGWNTPGGWNDHTNKEPFATVYGSNRNTGGIDHDFYPMPRRYGNRYDANNTGHYHGSMNYNAPFFANLMAWAVYQSEFFGANVSSLNSSSSNDF